MIATQIVIEYRSDLRFDRTKKTEIAATLDANRDNSPLSEWIAKVVVITVFSVTERILSVFVREAKAL